MKDEVPINIRQACNEFLATGQGKAALEVVKWVLEQTPDPRVEVITEKLAMFDKYNIENLTDYDKQAYINRAISICRSLDQIKDKE